jgi:hypothetical protein
MAAQVEEVDDFGRLLDDFGPILVFFDVEPGGVERRVIFGKTHDFLQ